MHEIKCPNCGKVFSVDDSGFAAIVSQVRDTEFHREIEEREKQFQSEKKTALQLAQAAAENEKEKAVSTLKQEMERLKARLESSEKDKTLAVNEAVSGKKDELAEKDRLILTLENQLKEADKDNKLKVQSLRDNYGIQLKAKDETIEFYKDLKTRMSTKMVGETL